MSESHAQRTVFAGDGTRESSLFSHSGLSRESLGPRYTNVKRSRMESGMYTATEGFPPGGLVQTPVFHSPVASTIAASVPTQSESTYSSK